MNDRDFISFFHSFKTIFCVCPCCGELLRLSDLRLEVKGKSQKTWLDDYESQMTEIETKEHQFEEKKKELKQAAIDRGRKKVPMLLHDAIDSSVAKLNYNPYDIKAVLHPIDFVVFNGLRDKEAIKNIVFLSKTTENPHLIQARSTTRAAIEKENYGWQLIRVDDSGKIDFESS